jgi:spore germination protein KA
MWFHHDEHKKTIQELTGKSADIMMREIKCQGETITILYIKQLTDRQSLSDFVIRPLMQYCSTAKKPIKADEAMDSVLYADECKLENKDALAEENILNGMTVLLFSNDTSYIVANLKKVEHRPVTTPELNYNQRAPRDSFVENLDVNLSLMRYRLKDRNLRVEYMDLGERTRAHIAVIYIQDVANDACVQEIKKRIGKIQTDGILESGEVQAYLLNNKLNLFPQMMVVERSDMAAENLLEGKVLLLVEGSPLALSAPVAFIEFLYACDDRYENKFFGLFMHLLRLAAFFISFSASSYWVAMVAFHSDILPAGFIIALSQARSKVPFSAMLGVLILEFIMELIRESLLRVPMKIGSAIAIVGALIIGQAAITAGVFSPLILIIISVEFLASFAIPYQAAANPFRMIKFMMLLVTSMFGFYGFILGLTVVVAEMVSINDFGVPYSAPYGPFNLYDAMRTLMYSKTISPKRQQYMRDKDDTRMGK